MYNTVLGFNMKCAKYAKNTDMTDDITERKQQKGHFDSDPARDEWEAGEEDAASWEDWEEGRRSKGLKVQNIVCTKDVHVRLLLYVLSGGVFFVLNCEQLNRWN